MPAHKSWPSFGRFAQATYSPQLIAGLAILYFVACKLGLRLAIGRKVFDRAEDIFKFLFLACILAPTVSASAGAASLFLTGFSRGMQLEQLWLTWWLGDMTGAILVTPCFLLWSAPTGARRSQRQLVLQGAALVSLLLVGAIVFGDFLFPNAQDYPLKFICIPFVVWIAFALRPRETALAMLAFSGLAIGSALHAARGLAIPNESLLVLQVFLGVAALTSLLVSVAGGGSKPPQETAEKAT